MRKWRVVPFNRNYEISNDGLCRSRHQRFEGKYLTPAYRVQSDVYVLCKNYSKKAYTIGYLVYSTFVEPVPKGYVVAHLDGNLKNNHLDNLIKMRLGDKIFYWHKREKKIPRVNKTPRYIWTIDNKSYKSSKKVLEMYPNFGTRQNLFNHTKKWLNKRGRYHYPWDPRGFMIDGVLIKVKKIEVKNPTMVRMDNIKEEYKI